MEQGAKREGGEAQPKIRSFAYSNGITSTGGLETLLVEGLPSSS